MSDIIRIIIKSASGYGPIDEAYEDKLVITSSSINYEYKPYVQGKSENNKHKKWSYKTTSPMFKETFKRVAEMTPFFLYNKGIPFATDIGPTIITATFEDKHRETANFFCPSDFFEDYFITIKKMIPACEHTPVVLMTSEDFEDEEGGIE